VKKIAVISLMFIFALTSMAFAELKVGIVDMQKALDECEAGKAAASKMEKKYKEMQEKIQGRRDNCRICRLSSTVKAVYFQNRQNRIKWQSIRTNLKI